MQEKGMVREAPIERNIAELFWSVLCRWKWILLIMLLAALALGGMSFYKNYKVLKDPKAVAKQQQEYQEALDSYESQKSSLEKKLQNLEGEQKRLDEYSNTAIMLFVDQYNVYEYTGSYYINTNYEIAPELFYQNPNYTSVITKSYQAAIHRLDLDALVSGGQEQKLTCQNPMTDDSLRLVNTSVDDGNGILNFTVYGDTQARVDQIANAIRQVLQEQEKLLNQAIGSHTLEVLSEENRTAINTDFGRMQTAFANKKDSVISGIKTNTDKLKALSAPTNESPSRRKLVVSAVKQSILGLVGGLIAAIAFFALKTIFQDKVISAGELRDRYHYPVLGAYTPKRKQAKPNCCIMNKLGMPHTDSAQEAADLIAANIRYYMKDVRKLLLLGTDETESLKNLQKVLKTRLEGTDIQVVGNVNVNPAAVAALEEEAALICVERFSKSNHKEIGQEMQLIRAFGDRSVGFVLTVG